MQAVILVGGEVERLNAAGTPRALGRVIGGDDDGQALRDVTHGRYCGGNDSPMRSRTRR